MPEASTFSAIAPVKPGACALRSRIEDRTGRTTSWRGAEYRKAWLSNSTCDEEAAPSAVLGQQLRVRRVADAEERHLSALPPLGRRVLPDAEQQVVGDGVQVGRVAEQLELAEDLGAVGSARPIV